MRSPVNEMGVVSLFAQYAQGLGYVIMEIQAPFPDATVYEIKTKEVLRVEIEFKAKNFRLHRHDPNGCDMIVCWEDDWPECPLPVLELCRIHDSEPIETVFELQEKVERLKEKKSRLGEDIEKQAELEQEIRVQLFRNEQLQDRIIDLKQRYRNIRKDARKEYVEIAEGAKGRRGKFDGKEYNFTGIATCPRCKSPVIAAYEDQERIFALDETETIKIYNADVKCKHCGAVSQYYGWRKKKPKNKFPVDNSRDWR